MVQISDAFEVEGFVEQRKELDRLLMSNPAMEKKVQGLIRKVLSAVKKNLGQAAREKMKSDPSYIKSRSKIFSSLLRIDQPFIQAHPQPTLTYPPISPLIIQSPIHTHTHTHTHAPTPSYPLFKIFLLLLRTTEIMHQIHWVVF